MSITTHVYTGRRQLFTEYLPEKMRKPNSTAPLLDGTTVPTVIKNVWGDHMQNGIEIEYLINYYKGRQDILDRKKVVRPDVDNRVVFNHAMAITRSIVGYTFGKPIRYVHRTSEAQTTVADLNSMVEAEDKFTSDQELATYASICGTSYRGVFMDAYGVEDDIPFSIVTLDPVTTFVVYSSEIGHAPVMACTFYEITPTQDGTGKHVYLVYTPEYVYRYETTGQAFGILSADDLVEVVENALGEVPIVEYPNNSFRIGDWEMVKTLLDSINIVGSDSVNELEQTVNSILVAINCELDSTAKENIKNDKMASIISSKELPAELKYLAPILDGGTTDQLRSFLMEQLRLVVGIPSRDNRSGGGGDTGDSVYLRDGYQDLEVVARTKETFFKRAERNTLKLIVKLCQISDGLLKGLATRNVDIKFTRNMTDNVLNKANAIAILHGTQTLDPVDVLSIVGITSEPDDLIKRGDKYWENKMVDSPTPENEIKLTHPEDESLKQKVDR